MLVQIFTWLCALLANPVTCASLVFFLICPGPIVFQLSKLKIIEQIIEEWIYCYPSRTLSEEKIEILKEQHYQNLRDDMRGVVSGIFSAPAWICREIDLEEGANWFLVVATCLDLIHSNKDGKIITKYTDHFHNNLG